MSLKALHIVFVTASVLLCAGFGVWAFGNYLAPEGTWLDLAYGVGAAVGAVVLLVYGWYFLKKLRNISYL